MLVGLHRERPVEVLGRYTQRGDVCAERAHRHRHLTTTTDRIVTTSSRAAAVAIFCVLRNEIIGRDRLDLVHVVACVRDARISARAVFHVRCGRCHVHREFKLNLPTRDKRAAATHEEMQDETDDRSVAASSRAACQRHDRVRRRARLSPHSSSSRRAFWRRDIDGDDDDFEQNERVNFKRVSDGFGCFFCGRSGKNTQSLIRCKWSSGAPALRRGRTLYYEAVWYIMRYYEAASFTLHQVLNPKP